MAQLSDDCFAFGGASMPLQQARSRIGELYAPVTGIETVGLAAAAGRILAHDIHAPVDLPPHTNSAVDGYAVYHADLHSDRPTELPLHGRAAAGHPSRTAQPRGTAGRIFTGAVMPDGPDTVMMQEDCTVTATGILVLPGICRGANRRPAGEDIARSALALAAGHRLSPADIGLLAALGLPELQVRARLRVAVFSTGDELAEPGTSLRPGAVYDANRFMLAALLGRLGAEVVDGGMLPDEVGATGRALVKAAGTVDLIVTSGGVSIGDEDHVRDAIMQSGALNFWRVAIKPGRPVALGRIGDTPLLGLPGNPVAALVTFAAIGRPLLDRLAGARFEAPVQFLVPSTFAYRKKAGRLEYIRVRIVEGGARLHPKEGAGIITSLTESDVLMELPEEMTDLAPGDLAACIPLGLVYG
jgi:molybdopterin molybdotransferase